MCLLNVSFKIFTKVVTNRITEITKKVISPTQTTFLPERNIMEGLIILHKTIHEMHRRKQSGVLLKLDFEKAYDKINWTFVQQTRRMKGFSSTWRKWVASFMEGEHVGIKVNDQVGRNFQTPREVRQGDPLSPILFNIVVDMLAILINRAKQGGQISEVISNIIDDELSILQYADDTILVAFEQMSGLKNNYHKSELFYFGEAKDHELQYEQLVGCKKGPYPFRYLGIPMHYMKLYNNDWKMTEERIEKKMSSWKGKCLSVDGLLVLINSVLTSLTMFMLSFFKVPKGVLEKIDYYRSRFFLAE
jgi:hypothetical protein